MEELLKKVRKMNWVLQESTTGAFSFNDLCEILSEIMAANVYITSRNGKVLGAHYEDKPSTTAIVEDEDHTLRFPENYNDALMGIDETTANLSVSESKKLFNWRYYFYSVSDLRKSESLLKVNDKKSTRNKNKTLSSLSQETVPFYGYEYYISFKAIFIPIIRLFTY